MKSVCFAGLSSSENKKSLNGSKNITNMSKNGSQISSQLNDTIMVEAPEQNPSIHKLKNSISKSETIDTKNHKSGKSD